jgi:predicted acetyltransferase
MSLTFRAAREADLDRLIDIHTSAFPDARGDDARRRNFATNPLGPLQELHVCERDGIVVAHAFLFALGLWVGGVAVRAGAVASVGVAPEARGQQIGAALLDYLHAEAAARGDAVTLLYPFRQGFYARHGYAPVTPTRRILAHPGAFPAAGRRADGITIRIAAAQDREALLRVYDRSAARTTGWLARPASLWTRILHDERRVWIVAERAGAVVGYVQWSLFQPESHAATRLIVHEIAAEDVPARLALLGCVGAQRDQIAEVEIDVDDADPLDRALVDPDRSRYGTAALEHALGTLVGGPMVRIVDVRRALEARGYTHDGAIEIAVEGEAPVELDVRTGRATVGPPRGAPRITIGRTALAAVLYGALSARDAARLGWIEADAAALDRAAVVLALPPYFSIDSF